MKKNIWLGTMRTTLCRFVGVLLILGGLFITTASAQDFQKSYTISAGGRVNIHTRSGPVTIAGYDGEAVIVKGFRNGRDRDLVKIEDLSSPNSVDVRDRYPEKCKCDAGVRFEVQVPRSVVLRFEEVVTMSGDIEMHDVTGELNAHSLSGAVFIKDVRGSIDARSMSGTVVAEISKPEAIKAMKFTSMSGDVIVKLKGSLDANIDLSSTSGTVKTDFPLEVHSDKYGPRRWVQSQLGSGSRSLRLESLSGNVSLTQLR
jgi:putative adhesin